MVTPLLVGRAASIAAVEAAVELDKHLCVAAQKAADIEEPGPDDLFDVATVIKVLQVIRTPDETLKILVEGVARVHVLELGHDGRPPRRPHRTAAWRSSRRGPRSRR